MLPLAVQFLTAPIFAASMAMEIGAIIGLTIAVIVCTALPLTTGMQKGHVGLGIIGALITLPAAALLGCLGGLPVALVCSLIIQLVPKFDRPLLSQAEIEAETRRMRGY
jgi:hypothetical protein